MEIGHLFAFEEYRALRSESLERFKADYAIQRNGILASGALASFGFSVEIPSYLKFFIFCTAGLIMLISYYQQARQKRYGLRIGRYLGRIEKEMYGEKVRAGELTGWENFLVEVRSKEKEEQKALGDRQLLSNLMEIFKGDISSVSSTKMDARFLLGGSILMFIVAAGFLVSAVPALF